MSHHEKNSVKGYNLLQFEASFRQYLSAVILLKPVSVKNYISDLRYFSGWLGAHTEASTLSEINHETLTQYKEYLQKSDLPSKSINRRLSTMRKFFSFLVGQGHLTSNPTKGITNSLTKSVKVAEQTHHASVLLNQFEADFVQNGASKDEAQKHCANIQEFFAIINSSNTYGFAH